MKIVTNLFASLTRYKPEGIGTDSWMVECEEGTMVSTLLQEIGVPLEEVAVAVIFINGVHGKMESVLKDMDRLGVFPPVGGG